MPKFFYPLIKNPYREKDINEGIKVLKSGKLTMGSKTDIFQKTFQIKLNQITLYWLTLDLRLIYLHFNV